MRQSPPRARTISTFSILLIIVLALAVISCARLPRRVVSAENQRPSTTSTEEKIDARVNLNTASAGELEALPGIGKVLAERIVAHRQRYGPFRRAEHLMMVPGISDHKFRAIRSLVIAG
jgi:competence ComEA-like helix-hairpin-helix protein